LVKDESDPGTESAISDALESSDTSARIEALKYVCALLKTQDRLLPDPTLMAILDCARSSDDQLAFWGCEALRFLMSFNSCMSTFLLHNGVLDIISLHFPAPPTIAVLSNLALSTSECRISVFECGVLSQVEDMLNLGDTDLVSQIAHLLSCLTFAFDEPFCFDPFVEILIPLFASLFSKYDSENESLCREIVGALRDFVDADERFAEFFVSQSWLSPLLSSSSADDFLVQKLLRILEALSNWGQIEYIVASGGITWAENRLFSESEEVVCSIFSFFAHFLIGADESTFCDEFLRMGIAEQAMLTFTESSKKFRTRQTILGFLAEVIRGCSPSGLMETMMNGEFKLLIENWEMVDKVQLLEALVRFGAIERGVCEIGDKLFGDVMEDERLMEMISEMAHEGRPWSALAGIVGQIIWATSDDDHDSGMPW
jgi:hypothetical protein